MNEWRKEGNKKGRKDYVDYHSRDWDKLCAGPKMKLEEGSCLGPDLYRRDLDTLCGGQQFKVAVTVITNQTFSDLWEIYENHSLLLLPQTHVKGEAMGILSLKSKPTQEFLIPGWWNKGCQITPSRKRNASTLQPYIKPSVSTIIGVYNLGRKLYFNNAVKSIVLNCTSKHCTP